MISLSKKDFDLVIFLAKHFMHRFSMRQIASNLSTSAAGMHKILKKLESHGILKSERLGSGLFYDLNLDNEAVKHLVLFSLTIKKEKYNPKLEELKNHSEGALLLNKKLLLIEPSEYANPDSVCHLLDLKLITKTNAQLKDDIKQKNKEIVEIINKGTILWGEEHFIEMVKNAQ